MGNWDSITEAKIKEWQGRNKRGETDESTARGDGNTVDSIESQLFDEIVAARRTARSTDDPLEREALRKHAKKTQLRLMVLLEKGGFPLLARTLQARLNEAVDEDPA